MRGVGQPSRRAALKLPFQLDSQPPKESCWLHDSAKGQANNHCLNFQSENWKNLQKKGVSKQNDCNNGQGKYAQRTFMSKSLGWPPNRFGRLLKPKYVGWKGNPLWGGDSSLKTERMPLNNRDNLGFVHTALWEDHGSHCALGASPLACSQWGC